MQANSFINMVGKMDDEIKDLSYIACLIVARAEKATEGIFGDQSKFPAVLQVLTHLTAQQMNIGDYQQQTEETEQMARMKNIINAGIAAQRK